MNLREFCRILLAAIAMLYKNTYLPTHLERVSVCLIKNQLVLNSHKQMGKQSNMQICNTFPDCYAHFYHVQQKRQTQALWLSSSKVLRKTSSIYSITKVYVLLRNAQRTQFQICASYVCHENLMNLIPLGPLRLLPNFQLPRYMACAKQASL